MSTKIVLIVGSSGVGKDTLLRKAKLLLDNNFNFVKRYITRKPCENEDNFYLDAEALNILKSNKFFVSTWNAHNNSYAIAKNSIRNCTNIISISRSKIKEFEDIYENVFTINITVSKGELKKRLENRARESKEEINKRLNRTYEKIEAKNLIDFENSKELDESVKEFCNLIKSL